MLLVAPSGEHLKYIVQMHFAREEATNNTSEYEGLLVGLRIVAELGIKKLIIQGDSQLVARQVNKDYQSPLMEAYIEEVRRLEEHFDGLQTEHVPRAENNIADHLSKCAGQTCGSRNFCSPSYSALCIPSNNGLEKEKVGLQ